MASVDGEDGIADENYSLNAGRYVGVVVENDGLSHDEYKSKMIELSAELENLSKSASDIESEIVASIREVFGE